MRHGFDNPDSIRQILARSTRLARKQFDVEFANFTFSSCENPDQVVCFGGLQDNDIAALDRTGSVCSHALLSLSVPEIFQIPRLDEDFRFTKNPNLCLGGDRKFKFYVSVPVFLSSGDEKDQQSIPVGRMCLLSENEREWNSEEDAATLKDISTMTTDSLEKLTQTKRSKRMGIIQRSLTFLTRSIDESSLIDHSHCHGLCNPNPNGTSHSNHSSAITSDGFSFCSRRCELACSSIQVSFREC